MINSRCRTGVESSLVSKRNRHGETAMIWLLLAVVIRVWSGEFGDDLKEAVVKAEKNIDLFLNHHAYAVKSDKNHLVSVTGICAPSTVPSMR